MDTNLLKLLAEYGLPTLLLIFFTFVFMKPILNAFMENIKKQTEVLDTILKNCGDLKNDILQIKNKLES